MDYTPESDKTLSADVSSSPSSCSQRWGHPQILTKVVECTNLRFPSEGTDCTRPAHNVPSFVDIWRINSLCTKLAST